MSCGADDVSLLPADSIVAILLEAFDKHLAHGDFEEDSDGFSHEEGEPAAQVIRGELGVTWECADELLERMNERVAALSDAGEPVNPYSCVIDQRPASTYWLGR